MSRFKTISVDIDVDDVIGSISTEDLIEELQSRNGSNDEDFSFDIKDFIEKETNRIIESFTDQEICDWILHKLGRK